MKDFVEVYKRVGKEEYVIHTILNPRGTTATLKWYIRSRPFHGSTKIDIIKEGTKKIISLVKGNYKANDLWQLSRRHFVNEIDEYIKKVNALESIKEVKVEEVKKPEVKLEVKTESSGSLKVNEVPKNKLIVKDIEE